MMAFANASGRDQLTGCVSTILSPVITRINMGRIVSFISLVLTTDTPLHMFNPKHMTFSVFNTIVSHPATTCNLAVS